MKRICLLISVLFITCYAYAAGFQRFDNVKIGDKAPMEPHTPYSLHVSGHAAVGGVNLDTTTGDFMLLNVGGGPASNDPRNVIYGIKNDLSISQTAAFANVYGMLSTSEVSDTNTTSFANLFGIESTLVLVGAGTITSAYGLFADPGASGNPIGDLYGVAASANIDGSAVTNTYQLFAATTNVRSGNTTNNYGLYVQDQSATGDVLSYNIFSAGNGPNAFRGHSAFGSTAPVGTGNVIEVRALSSRSESGAIQATNTNDDSTGFAVAISGTANMTAVSNGADIEALNFNAENETTSTGVLLYGSNISIGSSGAHAGNEAEVNGSIIFPNNVSPHSIDNLFGYRMSPVNGSGTLTNAYAFYVDGLGHGTNRYAFYSADASDAVFIAGSTTSKKYNSVTDCASATGSCGSAPAGSFDIAAAGTARTVSTTAVTANSEIFIQEDSSLGTKLGVTCNTTIARSYVVTARTAGTSFVVTASAAPAVNPACLHYFIVN